MARPTFQIPRQVDSSRAWKASSLISLLLHGFALGAPGFAMPLNVAAPPETSVSIDLDLVAAAPAAPETAPPAASIPQAQAQLAEPEKSIEPEPAPKKAEAAKPEPAPKKAETRKQEQPRKIAATAKAQTQQVASLAPLSAKAKPASSPAVPPAPVGGASSPRPAYPELARKRGQEGTVNVRCQVDAQGTVTAVAIAKSSGFKLLDEAALKAVGKWKFRPGSKDGSSVAGTVVVPVQFRLQ